MAKPQQNNLLINLISDRPANIAKALRFGRKFLAAGWQVTLSINIEAVVLVNPEAELGPCPVSGKPLTQLLSAFMAEGGEAKVGKECLGLTGMKEDDLATGLSIATFPDTEKLMATPGLKIITW